jgi:hypothetical protein
MLPVIDISVVNHAHGNMVGNLVAKLQSCPEVSQVFLTSNIPDDDGVLVAETPSSSKTVPRSHTLLHDYP